MWTRLEGEEAAAGVRAGALPRPLFIPQKTLLTHCLRHASLEIVESLI